MYTVGNRAAHGGCKTVRTELFDMGAKEKSRGLTPDQIDQIWQAYPRKRGKKAGIVAIVSAGKRAL